jgi:hypothetical protein
LQACYFLAYEILEDARSSVQGHKNRGYVERLQWLEHEWSIFDKEKMDLLILVSATVKLLAEAARQASEPPEGL